MVVAYIQEVEDLIKISLGVGATLGSSGGHSQGWRCWAVIMCFQDLPLPAVLFCTSYFCCVRVHFMLLLASVCGNTILRVLLLHCILVFLQSLFEISTSLPNVYLFTFTTGNLIHHTFLLFIFDCHFYSHQRLCVILPNIAPYKLNQLSNEDQQSILVALQGIDWS